MWLSTLLERYHSAREALYRAHTPEFVTTADEAPIPGHSARWSSSDAVDGTARPRLISSMPSHHDDEPWLVIPAHRQIFANWHLHLDQIEAYFFDFDYTLAEYEGVKALLYHQMLRFLVEQKGYPDELLALQFDPVFAQRGAYLHPEQGVSVKFDKNKVPTRGFRGRTPLRPDELERLRADKYAGALRIEFHSKQFIDSHFQFVDLCLASDLWEFAHRNPTALNKSPQEIYNDLGEANDAAHGCTPEFPEYSFKPIVTANPERYIKHNPELIPLLLKLRGLGKKTAIVTNSPAAYVSPLLDYMFDDAEFADETGKTFRVTRAQLFDITIASAQKGKRRPWRKDDSFQEMGGKKTGFFGDDEEPTLLDNRPIDPDHVVDPHAIYTGSHRTFVQRALGVQENRCLLVDDEPHRSIRQGRPWETLLIVSDLEDTLIAADKETGLFGARFRNELRRRRHDLSREERRASWEESERRRAQFTALLGPWGDRYRAHTNLGADILDASTGYTTCITNLGLYDLSRRIDGDSGYMPHELLVVYRLLEKHLGRPSGLTEPASASEAIKLGTHYLFLAARMGLRALSKDRR